MCRNCRISRSRFGEWTMFSQLCRARPRTLWEKVVPRQTAPDERPSEGDAPQRIGEVDLAADDPRCQLEHCTFCDYRVCCQVTSAYDKDTQNLELDPCLKATENPAYGLSAKNWLELSDDPNEENPPPVVNATMESSFNELRQNKDSANDLINTNLKCTSQPDQDCDGTTIPMKMNSLNIPPTHSETRSQRADSCNERSKQDKASEQKHSGLTWSVLKHRQLVGDTAENCDKSNPCVIEHSLSDIIPNENHHSHEKSGMDPKLKRNVKDRSFPLSLMKPITKMGEKKLDISSQLPQSYAFKSDLTRQRPVQKTACSKFTPAPTRGKMEEQRKSSNDILGVNNPLSTIAQIKTEESIQEWLARISDSSNGICEEDVDENDKTSSNRSPWDTNESKNKETLKNKLRNETTQVINKGLQEALEMSHSKNYSNNETKPHYDADYPSQDDENTDTITLLYNASKASPANIPMVVMQCSRLHSHIGSKPPFQQTSLPMGTLVTALYQESDWLYVQTPHGVEGFIIASNCVPIGTTNDPGHTSRRPWEPCDFPIEINVRRKCEFGRQQGAYIPAKLPTNNNKQAAPYVNTVKMKTNFYSDRYFSHTFKSKDSIKTAKTVTDILRNSPETKVSNQ